MTNSDVDTSTSALVLIDLQNDNVHPHGAYASTGAAAHAESQNLVSHVSELLRARVMTFRCFTIASFRIPAATSAATTRRSSA
jgi:nicotinamidase-related amidase